MAPGHAACHQHHGAPGSPPLGHPCLHVSNLAMGTHQTVTSVLRNLKSAVENLAFADLQHPKRKEELLTRKEEKNDLITIRRWEKQRSEESDDTESETTDSDEDDHLQHQQKQENSSQLPKVGIMHDSVLKEYHDREKNSQSYNQAWTHSYNKQPYRRNYSTNDENVTYIGRQRYSMAIPRKQVQLSSFEKNRTRPRYQQRPYYQTNYHYDNEERCDRSLDDQDWRRKKVLQQGANKKLL
ncbi:hypothetical protein ACOMHN_030013 [Nucella lapillus]